MTTLASRSAAVATQKPGTSFAAGLLQRKCSCGTAKSPADETCEKCRSRRLQRRLAVGASYDAFELEADQVAERVLRHVVPAEPAVPVAIRRVPLPHADPNDAAPDSVERVLGQSGTPLEPGLRADMERRFGHDFGAVRIHRGGDADLSARDVNALAYTVGPNIVFGDGQYSPATQEGRRLLAHELTHVVQQGGSTGRLSARHVQRDKPKRAPLELPEKIRDDEASYSFDWQLIHVPLRSNVQWHFDREIPGSFLLLLSTKTKEREQLKKEKKGATWVARFCVEQLRLHFGLEFAHGDTELVDYIAPYMQWLFEPSKSDFFNISVDVSGELMKKQFNADDYDAYIEALRTAFTPTDYAPLLAYADLAIFGDTSKPGPKHHKLAPWVASKKSQLDSRLKELKTKGRDRPVDLPDEVVAWFNEKDASWYLNVWVWFDTSGKSKKGQAIKLKEGESVEKLLERTRAAVQKAVDKQSAEDETKREREFPRWARKLKDDLDKALRIATGGKKTDDAPDGTLLSFGSPGLKAQAQDPAAPTAGTLVDAPPQVMLTIWVQRGEEHIQKNHGSVPIFETTTLAQLVPYVRQLAAMLRQFEHTPSNVAVKPWQQADKLTLPAFEAYLMPMDLRPDHITVTGARNKFSMFLDFEKQYEMIVDPTGLGVASKLYNQAIFFEWRVYQVPGNARALKREGEEDNWPDRWKELYLQFNPKGLADDGKQIPTAPSADNPVDEPPAKIYEARGDITDRIKFNDEPGEYLVSCRTLSAPVGKSDLTRSSSRAYYPVRTEPMTSIVGPQVTQTTAELQQVEADLKQIETALKLENIKESEQKVLLATKTSKLAHKKVLETKETRGLVATTRVEIDDAEARLKAAERLDKKLPELIKQAKANQEAQKEPTEPSRMIEDDPELLAVYWQTLSDKVSAKTYASTLKKQIKDLNEVHKRAVEFSDEFKGEDSGACAYSPEAVFLSELDGHIYPLVLMVGEAENNKVMGAKVAYRLADVTSPQTQKVYYGYSFKDGPEGHLEAIDNAFEDFGESATYGEGWIAVRMPKGRDECANLHRQGVHAYESKEGILEKVWKFLGFIAAVAGIAALVATGVGAGAAAALLGVLAAGVGAAVSIHNIVDRSRRHNLKADAELAMDILGIVGLAEIGAAKALTYFPKAVRGFVAAESFGRFIAVYRVGVEAASFVLIPIKLQEDIDYIRALPISDAEKEEMIRAAFSEALTGILMVAASSVTARAAHGGGGHGGAGGEADVPGMHQQAELMSLEHVDNYKSMRERGWIDENGGWTESAPDPMRRQRSKALEEGAPHAHPSAEPPPKAAIEAVERVNSGEVEVHGKKPGERYADMGDGHQVAEVPTGMGISCEYHSKTKVEVSCPFGMGSKQTKQEKIDAEASRKAADDRWKKLNEATETKKARDEKQAELEAKHKDESKGEPTAAEKAPVDETPDALKAVRKANREQQKSEANKAKDRLNQKLDDARDLVIQIENEIQQTERKLKKSMSLKSRKKLEAELEGLRFKKERAQEMRAPIEKSLKDVEVTPYDRARSYSYSDAAGDAVVARARGRDEMSGLPIREPSIDHIVPVNDIVEMPGYNKLLPHEQRALLSHEDNLVMMEKGLNSAKQDKRWSQWDFGRQKYGDTVADRMILREREMRDVLSKQIVAVLAKRGVKP